MIVMNSRTKDMVRFKTLSKLSKAHSKIANDFTGSRLVRWLANEKKQGRSVSNHYQRVGQSLLTN